VQALMRAEEIEGWMEPEELRWLSEQAAGRKVIVEIGSYLGRSTMALADATPGMVYAVDNFYGPTDGCQVPDRMTIFARFCQNLKDHIAAGKVVAVRADHEKIDPRSLPIPDMVFIDGDHSYESVKKDIQKWEPELSFGGLFCGHDLDYRFPGVQQALQELVPDYKAGPGRIWYR